MRAYLSKDKRRMRAHVADRYVAKAKGHHTKVDVKRRRKYLLRNPVADVTLGDDGLTYIPFRYIRGTIRVPGAATGKGYVAQ